MSGVGFDRPGADKRPPKWARRLHGKQVVKLPVSSCLLFTVIDLFLSSLLASQPDACASASTIDLARTEVTLLRRNVSITVK
jgi:hypothetical protein